MKKQHFRNYLVVCENAAGSRMTKEVKISEEAIKMSEIDILKLTLTGASDSMYEEGFDSNVMFFEQIGTKMYQIVF